MLAPLSPGARSLAGLRYLEILDGLHVAHPLERIEPSSPVAVVKRALLDDFAPAYAILSQDRGVLYTGDGTDCFLLVPIGTATHDLLDMIRRELRADVGMVLTRSLASGEHSSVLVNDGKTYTCVCLACAPLPCEGEPLMFLMVFHDCGAYEPGKLPFRRTTEIRQ